MIRKAIKTPIDYLPKFNRKLSTILVQETFRELHKHSGTHIILTQKLSRGSETHIVYLQPKTNNSLFFLATKPYLDSNGDIGGELSYTIDVKGVISDDIKLNYFLDM